VRFGVGIGRATGGCLRAQLAANTVSRMRATHVRIDTLNIAHLAAGQRQLKG
jgi:hypothetical protein